MPEPRPLIAVAGALALCSLGAQPARAFDSAGPLAERPTEQVREQAPAALPPSATGLVSAWGGVRWVPQGAFLQGLEKKGLHASQQAAVQPTFLLPFGYRIDPQWAVQIEFGYGLDRFAFADGRRLGLSTVTIQAGFERCFQLSPRFEAFLGAGAGYHLTWAERTGADGPPKTVEAHATGLYAAAGLRYAVTDGWGIALQERYALAYAGLAGLGDIDSALNVGGSTTALGVYYVWRD